MRSAILALFAALLLLLPGSVGAQAPEAPVDELLPATVVYIVDQSEIEVFGQSQTVQTLELALAVSGRRGEIVTAVTGAAPSVNPVTYGVGDRVYVRRAAGPAGDVVYEVATRDRTLPLALLALLFVALVVVVGRGHGLRALLALGLSFVIILFYVLPRVAAGATPMTSALIGCGLSMPVSYYLSHGLNRKTSIALAGSLVGLLFTGLLTVAAVWLVGLTGYSGDDAGFVSTLYGGAINLRGLLMAGMIIGVLGVLDDISVAQAATVEQIHGANRSLDRWELFRRGMSVGQDHISSMVNTLMLVYAGTSLALLLLLTNQDLPLGYVLSQELVAEELVRMLVTSTGLVVTVPVTTGLAAALLAGRAGAGAAGGGVPGDQPDDRETSAVLDDDANGRALDGPCTAPSIVPDPTD